jgi:formamidopyrimidine-DNA glycosylase
VIELPEAFNLAQQLTSTISGKRVVGVTTAHTPHKLAWYYGDPKTYSALLNGTTIGQSKACGGLVEIKAGEAGILLGEDTRISFHAKDEPRLPRHQLLIDFEDSSALVASVKMYGGVGSYLDGQLANNYYRAAREKPSPFSPAFDQAYFNRLIFGADVQKLSLKALLATEQRVPGLGNGILQDILFNARMHPRKKANSLSYKDVEVLFNSLKTTLAAMASGGGRDTEFDLFGHPGGYQTILDKNAVNRPCPLCGTIIKKEAYMGGSVYYCETCQSL